MKKIIFLTIVTLLFVGCQANVSNSNSSLEPVQNTNNNQNEPMSLVEKVESNNSSSQPVKIINNNLNESMPLEKVEENTKAVIKTNMGDITFKLYDSDAPKTVANFMKLSKKGFYNGTKFHRVIKDFMIQAGDPLSKDDAKKAMWGTGDPGYKFEDEINSHKIVKGSLAMANSGPDTNGSQFFIVTAEATPWLDGMHTCFGEVVDGIDVVLKIENVKTEGSDRPVEDVEIISIEIK